MTNSSGERARLSLDLNNNYDPGVPTRTLIAASHRTIQ
jgi:hypothetical protein